MGLITLAGAVLLMGEREGRRALPGEGEKGWRRRLVAALKRVSIISVLPWIWSLLLVMLGALFIVAGTATELPGYKTMLEDCREEKAFCNGLQHVAQHFARSAAAVSQRERERERERSALDALDHHLLFFH